VFQTLCVVITFDKCVILTFDSINIYMLCLKYSLVVKYLLFTYILLLFFFFCNVLWSETK
jgi:hypothetical protein